MNPELSLNSLTEERALSLLGSGIPPENVANALGVSPSRISQLMSQENFAIAVAQKRYESLAKHNERDSSYDSLEDTLVKKLADLLPLMMRPMEVLKAIQIINGAKRRGASAPDQITQQQTVVQLVVPIKLVQTFTTNANNQVIQAGTQNLVTMQSGTLLSKVKQNDPSTQIAVSDT